LCLCEIFLFIAAESAITSGGVIPPTITATMTSLPVAPAEVTKAVPVTHRKSRGRYENFQKS
jgi:hypothetical protein